MQISGDSPEEDQEVKKRMKRKKSGITDTQGTLEDQGPVRNPGVGARGAFQIQKGAVSQAYVLDTSIVASGTRQCKDMILKTGVILARLARAWSPVTSRMM